MREEEPSSRLDSARDSVSSFFRRHPSTNLSLSNINYGRYAGGDSEDEIDDDGEARLRQATIVPAGSTVATPAAGDSGAFFRSGREYESTFVNHRYTAAEKDILQSYQALDYLPPDSVSYRKWLREQQGGSALGDWDRFLVMGIIGVSVGFVGFLLHQMIDLIADTKWNYAADLVQRDLFLGWLWVTGYSVAFLLPSTLIVVYLRPSASGSGMPELIGFLNGTFIRHIFNIKTLVAKFFSCALAVASGMPVGPEGPMIHMGALIGAGISQFQSKTLGIKLPLFERFRNSQDRRNFISAGAAAGIASAFGAPVGGLLFAMEEVSSYWNMRLSWQVFFCCMVSTFTTDLLDSAFSAFQYEGGFGQFKTDRYILFNVQSGIDMNILALLPCALLGAIGGILGSLFTFCNLKIVRLRRRLHLKVQHDHILSAVKFMEPLVILVLACSASVLLPLAFQCSPIDCVAKGPVGYENKELCYNSYSGLAYESNLQPFTCPGGGYDIGNGSLLINGSYNQAATLFFGTGENAIHHLFSRNTHLQFEYGPLLTMLIVYFFLACWTAGTSISSGIVVPMLLIGALYGRIVGRFMVDAFGVQTEGYWDWIDPGAMALLGAVSFFGGVSRLTMSLTVIMVEMTNDIQFLLLIMTTVMVAKWVGDFLTHPIYHALLELKCIPFLDQEPVVITPQGQRLNMELFQAEQVMRSPVVVVHKVDSVARLAKILLDDQHGGYPVVNGPGDSSFLGLISRAEILLFLLGFHDGGFENVEGVHTPSARFDEIAAFMRKRVREPSVVNAKLEKLAHGHGGDTRIDLSNYVNTSSVSVPTTFSLERTHLMFRSLGLRHLTVVDSDNHVQGILTRKDLMGFALEDRLVPLSRGQGVDASNNGNGTEDMA